MKEFSITSTPKNPVLVSEMCDLLEQKEEKRMVHKFLKVTRFMSIYFSVGLTSRIYRLNLLRLSSLLHQSTMTQLLSSLIILTQSPLLQVCLLV
jgi:hypothetical protein